MTKQYKCDDCGTVFTGDEMLKAPSPFDDEDIYGCPGCKIIWGAVFRSICDEDGCNEIAGCGWPSTDGYRNTCHKHMAK